MIPIAWLGILLIVLGGWPSPIRDSITITTDTYGHGIDAHHGTNATQSFHPADHRRARVARWSHTARRWSQEELLTLLRRVSPA